MKNALSVLGLMAFAATADHGTGIGNDVVWLGQSQPVHLALLANCSGNPPPPFPGESCVVLNPQPALTNYKLYDPNVAFTLSGNATHSSLCLTVKPSGAFNYQNLTAARMPFAQFNARASIRLENPVLDDPTLINPVTGKPFNGAIEFSSLLHSEVRALDPNETFGCRSAGSPLHLSHRRVRRPRAGYVAVTLADC